MSNRNEKSYKLPMFSKILEYRPKFLLKSLSYIGIFGYCQYACCTVRTQHVSQYLCTNKDKNIIRRTSYVYVPRF